MNTPATSYGEIRSYVQLQRQIHDDLRIQHPEWVQPDGESPMCDSYEARLLELLGISTLRGSNESIAAPYHALDFLGGKGGQFSPNQTQITGEPSSGLKHISYTRGKEIFQVNDGDCDPVPR